MPTQFGDGCATYMYLQFGDGRATHMPPQLGDGRATDDTYIAWGRTRDTYVRDLGTEARHMHRGTDARHTYVRGLATDARH